MSPSVRAKLRQYRLGAHVSVTDILGTQRALQVRLRGLAVIQLKRNGCSEPRWLRWHCLAGVVSPVTILNNAHQHTYDLHHRL